MSDIFDLNILPCRNCCKFKNADKKVNENVARKKSL